MGSANGNALPANCEKSALDFPSLHRSKGRLWIGQPAFRGFLEEKDQEDDDENDQENCPQTDVHRDLLSVWTNFFRPPRSQNPLRITQTHLGRPAYCARSLALRPFVGEPRAPLFRRWVMYL